MASIRKLVSTRTGEVSYRAQVRVKGHARHSANFPTKREAKEWAESMQSAIREVRYHPHLRGARTTFGELVARYESSAAFLKLEPAGQRSRKHHLKFFRDDWDGLSLAEIQPDRVATARDKLLATSFRRGHEKVDEHGRVIAPKEYRRTGGAVNRYLATLSHLFTLAMTEWNLLDRNPVRGISKAKESRGRVRFLSDDERATLIAACSTSDWRPLAALVLLAISTGARRGELTSLKWEDVDMKAGRATVHDTKNGDRRVLPLVGKALGAIRQLKLNNSAKSAYVFPHPNGLPEPYYHFDSHWYAAISMAKLQNFRFHDLRHTTASYLAAQGASLLEIADTLGHKTMAMVKRYSHLATDHKASVVARMAKAKDL